jgi:hypothetical protein
VINRRYLSTAATCSVFQKKTGWLFFWRGKATLQRQPIKTVKPEIQFVA